MQKKEELVGLYLTRDVVNCWELRDEDLSPHPEVTVSEGELAVWVSLPSGESPASFTVGDAVMLCKSESATEPGCPVEAAEVLAVECRQGDDETPQAELCQLVVAIDGADKGCVVESPHLEPRKFRTPASKADPPPGA